MQSHVSANSTSVGVHEFNAPEGELLRAAAENNEANGDDVGDEEAAYEVINCSPYSAASIKVADGAAYLVVEAGSIQPRGIVNVEIVNSRGTSDHSSRAPKYHQLSQETCVENKMANTIPSFEETTELQSESVAKSKYFGKDLIPTVLLERLCKSVSPIFGKPCLNINTPSFVPKSLMQIVPSSKKLPTDDELIKRINFYDTRGILARQVMSIQEEALHRNYLVEDDDMFEEAEFDEEFTAHNFSIVAREGDLSPRAIQDNAPKKVKRERRTLEPTRVQPSRSTKSKSIKPKKSKR